MGKILLGLLVLCALIGCATTTKYEAKLNSWVGQDANSLIAAWGYPANSFDLPNGNKVYVYQRGGSMTTPITARTTTNVIGYGRMATAYSTTNIYGGDTINFWCRTFFEANPDNTIVTWRWEGNSCISR